MRLTARVVAVGSLLFFPVADGVALDTTPPTIHVDQLWVRSQVFDPACSPVQIYIRAEDNIGVTSVLWENNWGETGTLPGSESALPSLALRDGTTLFTLEAIDAAGNRGSTTFTLNHKPVDTSPPSWSHEGSASERVRAGVRALGDVNGDGFDDVLIRVGDYMRVYMGAVDGPFVDPSWSVGGLASPASAGDVNGDGYSDVIVGTRSYSNGQYTGSASLYLGSPAGLAGSPVWVTEGLPTPNNSTYGSSVAAAGDVNRDGFSDVLVTDPLLKDPSGLNLNQGRVYLFHGSAGGLGATPAWTAEGDGPFYRHVWTAASAGDVNRDGFDDVIVTLNSGIIRLYHGSWEGLRPAPAWTATTIQEPDYVISAEGAGDINGDGYDDVIVGCPFCHLQVFWGGAAFVYLGSASGLSGSPSWAVGGDSVEATLGRIASRAGDVDGDGYSDILVSETAAVCDSFARIHIYRGSAAGMEARPFRTFSGGGELSTFSAVGAGDVDGDHLDDLLISDEKGSSFGRASLYSGVPDMDRDGISAVQDCDDSGNQVWSEPGGVESLEFAADGVTLTWIGPVSMGGPASTARFDVLRATYPDGFDLSGSATCIETNEGPERLAVDEALPPPSGLYIYVARARNGCGEGPVSSDSSGDSYPGPTCP